MTSTEKKQTFVPLKEISKELNISFHFLTKIFQILSRHGFITSYRGPNGGVALAKQASDISLIDIITALEGNDFFEGCILALPGCGDEAPCPLHDSWGNIRDELKNMFAQTSFDELGNKINIHGLRLVANE
jgi:Rrf2 family protein